MTLKLVSDHEPVRDTLPEAWLRASWQWQIVWLRIAASGLHALADVADAQLERIRRW
jgi:hypothetical protein